MRIQHFLDDKGFPFHLEKGKRGFGDSTQRLGMIKIYEAITGEKVIKPYQFTFGLQLKMITRENGELVRHWDESSYWGKPGIMSRDNLFPILCAMALRPTGKEAKLFWTLLKRFGVLWNRLNIAGESKPWYKMDIMGPVSWCFALRMLGKITYPLVFLLDIWLVFQAINLVIRSYFYENETTNDLNFQCSIFTAHNCMTTPWVYIAEYIYVKRQSPHFVGKFGPQDAVESYFRDRGHSTPIPIPEIWNKLIDKYWGHYKK